MGYSYACYLSNLSFLHVVAQ